MERSGKRQRTESEKQWHDLQQKRARSAIEFSSLKSKDKVEPSSYEIITNTQFTHNDNSDTLLPELDEEDRALLEQIELEEALDNEEKRVKSIEDTRKSLPVYQFRDSFLEMVKNNQVIIVVGETGSGKTTQLPQYLFEDGYAKNGIIGCSQPRRVAAVSVATRVSDEVGSKLGDKVGYTIRFDDKSNSKTKIKYLTDGMLLREFLSDVTLSKYSALMIDEAHERTLSTDILLGLLKQLIIDRPNFKLIIASATINAQKFSTYFNDAPIFKIPGRRFPVEIFYTTKPEPNYLQAATTTVMQIHLSQSTQSGDILIFLTGQDEIETVSQNLYELSSKFDAQVAPLIICPIYANLPPEEQQKIFTPTPAGSRKVVIATNIAETSLTINGITFVIDCGFVKENIFKPTTGIESLEVHSCSKASVDQRAGRAGRTAPGKCFRLFPKSKYLQLSSNPKPEILRVNLTGVVLMMLSLGIKDLIHFDFMDPPSTSALAKSFEELYSLGALNHLGVLTKIGKKMSSFPTSPTLSRALIKASELNCIDQVLTIVSMLEEGGSIWINTKKERDRANAIKRGFKSDVGGDMGSLLNVYNSWIQSGKASSWCRDNYIQFKTLKRIENIRRQLKIVCNRLQLTLDSDSAEIREELKLILAMKALTAGFFMHTAHLVGEGYKTKKGQVVYIHPSSNMFDISPPVKNVIYFELVQTKREYMRGVMPVNDSWLEEYKFVI